MCFGCPSNPFSSLRCIDISRDVFGLVDLMLLRETDRIVPALGTPGFVLAKEDVGMLSGLCGVGQS